MKLSLKSEKAGAGDTAQQLTALVMLSGSQPPAPEGSLMSSPHVHLHSHTHIHIQAYICPHKVNEKSL